MMDNSEFHKDIEKIYDIKEKIIGHVRYKLGGETHPKDVIQNTQDVIGLLMWLQHYSFKRLADRGMIDEHSKWV